MSTKSKRLLYWSNLNATWESSGLSQQEFRKKEGVLYKQFVYWRGRVLNQNKPQAAKPRLLKVSMPTTPNDHQIITEPPSSLEVVMPTGVKLYVKAASDISNAAALIKLLGGEL